jgi:hypothetical protein
VREGQSVRLPPAIQRAEDGSTRIVPMHTMSFVFGEMLLQICRDYPSLPDPRSLTLDEIIFFYEGLRPELIRATKPKRK